MAEAFDRLVYKTESQGIVHSILPQFLSNLLSINQVAQVNGFISGPRLLTSGVIQGSILGSLLLLYVNDIFDFIH